MRVPRELLREPITVRRYAGAGARGPTYEPDVTMRASLQQTDALIADTRGVLVQVSTLVVIRPEDGPVAAESFVEAQGVKYRVVQCYAMPDTRRPSYYQLHLGSYGTGTGVTGGPGSGSGSGSGS